MSILSLKQLYLFELDNLHREISAYKQEQNLWVKRAGVNNTAGNLCLHLVGSINHFLGATLLNNGYVRNREAEFNTSNIPREQLLQSISNLKIVVAEVLDALTEDDLVKVYPFDFMGSNTTDFYLTRFLAHLSYHLGQISYHRRLIDVI